MHPDVDEPDALPPSLHYGNFDFLCTVISVVTYLADLIMDIIVCVYFYHLAVDSRHFWYFGLTLAFILLPSLTMTGFSFRWYLMDADNADLERVPLWKWILRLVVLMLQARNFMGNIEMHKRNVELEEKWISKMRATYSLYLGSDRSLLVDQKDHFRFVFLRTKRVVLNDTFGPLGANGNKIVSALILHHALLYHLRVTGNVEMFQQLHKMK